MGQQASQPAEEPSDAQPRRRGTQAPSTLRRSHLFIELEERRHDQWEERGRWNHAMEEDIVEGARHDQWSILGSSVNVCATARLGTRRDVPLALAL